MLSKQFPTTKQLGGCIYIDTLQCYSNIFNYGGSAFIKL